jgi:hypothetical protein
MELVPLAVLGHGQGELVEAAAEQLLPTASVIAAVGVAHEAQPAIRRDARDELGLRIDDRTVTHLAGRQLVERLAPLEQRLAEPGEQIAKIDHQQHRCEVKEDAEDPGERLGTTMLRDELIL